MLSDRLNRVLEVSRQHSNGVKTAILFIVLAVIGLIVALYDRTPSLSQLQVRFLSGHPSGNYHAIVDRLANEAESRGGKIENLSSAGSVENLTRLVAGRTSRDVQFALVQDGMDWPAGQHLQLIGRLGIPESFVLLGRDADRLRTLADLRGKRIGIGPVGSGTERVARQIFAQLPELNLQLSTPTLDEQFTKLQSGDLDLGAIVINENAQFLTEAVRDRQLQIFNLADAVVLSGRLPFARAGIIRAGQYDLVKKWPAEDKHVIQIDTLVLGNGRANWSATQGLITTLASQFPDFVRINRDQPNRTGLPVAPAARSYFENQGPDVVGVHAPWLVNIMPTASWIQLLFGFSILFNVMAFWHRFRLWRIDAARVHLESELPAIFPAGVTVGEIATVSPAENQRTPETRAKVDRLVEQLGKLQERCRVQSLSVLVPMGQEMSYRYQEMLMVDLIRALRLFRAKLEG